MATGLIERAEILLVRLAVRDDLTLRLSAVDAEAARFAHRMMWVSVAPELGTVMLTANGRERLAARGLAPARPPRGVAPYAGRYAVLVPGAR